MIECEKYLGLLMPSGKLKAGTFKEIQEKITKRVMRWKEKFISKAGQEILIKTVAQVIPTYSMSLFKLLKASVIILNWNKLCTLKKKGGNGIWDLHDFNLAMLAKQAWCLIHKNGSLFYRVYKARYFLNTSFLDSE